MSLSYEREIGVNPNPLEKFSRSKNKDFTDEIMDEFITQVKDKFINYGLDYNQGKVHMVRPSSSVAENLSVPNRVFHYENKKILFLFNSTVLPKTRMEELRREIGGASAVFSVVPNNAVYTRGYAVDCLEVTLGIRSITPAMVKEAHQAINLAYKILGVDRKVVFNRHIANRGFSYSVTKKDDGIIVHVDYFGLLFLDYHVCKDNAGDYDLWVESPMTCKRYDDNTFSRLAGALDRFGTALILNHEIEENLHLDMSSSSDDEDIPVIRADC